MCLSPGLLYLNIYYNNLINDGIFGSFVTIEMFKDIEKQSLYSHFCPLWAFVIITFSHYRHCGEMRHVANCSVCDRNYLKGILHLLCLNGKE